MLISLDSRCKKTVEYLVNNNSSVKVSNIAEVININKRSVYYDLYKINTWLTSNGVSSIETNGKGILLDNSQKEKIRTLLSEIDSNVDYQFSPSERVDIIICSLVLRTKPIYIDNLIEKCKVSRNSIISDLKNVDNKLQEFDLELNYTVKTGYKIKGDIIRKRSLFFMCFSNVIDFYRNEILKFDDKTKVEDFFNRLNDISDQLKVEYVPGTLFSIAALLSVVIDNDEKMFFSIRDQQEIKNTLEYLLVEEYFNELDKEDKYYLTLHLLGSRLSSVPLNLSSENDEDTKKIAKELVEEFSRIACVQFENTEQIEDSLYAHLKSSQYRYKFGIQLINPMLEKIKHEYSDLFEITRKTCKYLEQQLRVPIPDSEVAYITLHFGSYIDYKRISKRMLKIMIVCPNGIGTGNMLRREVRTLIPNAEVYNMSLLHENIDLNDYDAVISTVSFDKRNYNKEIIIVNPILTENDRVMILRNCMGTSSKTENLVDSIMQIAEPYIKEKDMNAFRKELNNKFHSRQYIEPLNCLNQEENILLSLSQDDHIFIFDEKMTWQNSIKKLGSTFIEKNILEKSYIDAIITEINLFGSYMFITDEVVLAHARPSDGAHKLDINLGIFKNEIDFPGGKNAKFIFLISAIDQSSHLHMLNDIITICSDKTNLNNIYEGDTSKEIEHIISECLNKAE